MSIQSIFVPDRMLPGLSSRTKPLLLATLCKKAGAALSLDPDLLLSRLLAREALGSTGVGSGIAMPHASLDEIKEPFVLLATLTEPIDFEAIDDKPVDIVCLLLNPAQANNEKLKCLAAISRQLGQPTVQAMIRLARSPNELYSAATYSDRGG
jgi:PTS system nitrogen regulatory IIA component